MQAAGGVHDQHVRAALFGGLYTVEHHRGRIRALLLLDDRHARALGPDGQLIGGGGAEGVACADDDAPAHRLETRGQLADRRGFAHAVHADDEEHHRGA